MKKFLTVTTAIILAVSMMLFAGCGDKNEANPEPAAEVTVLAAASLTDALDEIIA